jgi:hypothetical protein
VSRPLRTVSLAPPFEGVLLWLRLDHDDAWRFHAWESGPKTSIPAEAPPTTLSTGFRTPRDAAHFYTQVLTNPDAVVPAPMPRVPGRMPPSPACEYYWPPSLDDAVAHFEQDLAAPTSRQIPVDRVFILGAGFSAAFQFTTARDIVAGTLGWAEHCFRSDWFARTYGQVTDHLDLRFPDWRVLPPDLYRFLDSFFPAASPTPEPKRSDPLTLAAQGLSWERRNCETWFEQAGALPEDDNNVLPAFEALLATYLVAGRLERDVHQPWALDFARQLRPSDVILTFNWDVIPEALMVKVDTPFCRYDWTPSRAKLVKLHGSADLIGTPNPLMRGDMERNPQRFECVTECLWRARTAEDVLVRTKPVPFGRELFPAERYNKASILIMPPRYPLGYGFELVQFNWRKAKAALERAREIHIIGYSLPDADMAFHKLVASARSAWSEALTVDVWNPDPVVGTRAQSLFGERAVFHRAFASEFPGCAGCSGEAPESR